MGFVSRKTKLAGAPGDEGPLGLAIASRLNEEMAALPAQSRGDCAIFGSTQGGRCLTPRPPEGPKSDGIFGGHRP